MAKKAPRKLHFHNTASSCHSDARSGKLQKKNLLRGLRYHAPQKQKISSRSKASPLHLTLRHRRASVRAASYHSAFTWLEVAARVQPNGCSVRWCFVSVISTWYLLRRLHCEACLLLLKKLLLFILNLIIPPL